MEQYELQKLARVYKTVWCGCDLSSFVLFSYKKVLRVKRTIMVRGSWLTRSDCTVQSGSENHNWIYCKVM